MNNQHYYNVSTTSPIRATQAHNAVSEKYQFLSTATVIERLADYGWFPSRVDEARCREDKKGFQKHIVRLRNDSFMRTPNDSIPEIVIVNSHDRTATLQMYAGLFRIVCLNGLIAGDKWESFQFRHIGAGLSDQLDKAIAHTAFQVPLIVDRVEKWSNTRLDSELIGQYEKKAIELVNKDGKWAIPEGELTRVRRYADTDRDLYTVFNRAQEAITRGGYDRQNAAGVWTRARRLTDIKKVVELNRSLWDLTEDFARSIQ